jgi:tetratricopeptide (TPR) repeat protein
MSVPWEDDAQRARQLIDQARPLSEAAQFAEAAALFRQAYDLHPDPFPAARYIHCMRHQGVEQARAAVVFARQPVERWPEAMWLIREYVWAIYTGYLKAGAEADEEDEAVAEEDSGFAVRVKAARRILKLSREELPRTRAIFAICREARRRRQWPLVLEFAMALDGAALSDEPREENGRPLPSLRQQWLSHVTRAHLETGCYDACLQLAREGMERYPHVLYFPWWHALARVRSGNVEEGIFELEQLQQRFLSPWYLRRDLAEAYARLHRDEEAWRCYCEAANSAGEMKHRLPMLAEMAQLLERQERWDLALDHLRLAWALAAREEDGEKAAERAGKQVEQFRQRQAERENAPADREEAPPDPEPLLAACRQAWCATGR